MMLEYLQQQGLPAIDGYEGDTFFILNKEMYHRRVLIQLDLDPQNNEETEFILSAVVLWQNRKYEFKLMDDESADRILEEYEKQGFSPGIIPYLIKYISLIVAMPTGAFVSKLVRESLHYISHSHEEFPEYYKGMMDILRDIYEGVSLDTVSC